MLKQDVYLGMSGREPFNFSQVLRTEDHRADSRTKAAAAHMITLVIGGTGQYRRMKKRGGEQTKHTAAKPKALPWPDPIDTYLMRGHQITLYV